MAVSSADRDFGQFVSREHMASTFPAVSIDNPYAHLNIPQPLPATDFPTDQQLFLERAKELAWPSGEEQEPGRLLRLGLVAELVGQLPQLLPKIYPDWANVQLSLNGAAANTLESFGGLLVLVAIIKGGRAILSRLNSSPPKQEVQDDQIE